MKHDPKAPSMLLLQNVESGTPVLVQTAEHTNGPSPRWGSPFEDNLFVQRDGRGVACVLALENTDFAEFDPRTDGVGHAGDVEYHSEEYILRILKIGGLTVAADARDPQSAENLQLAQQAKAIVASAQGINTAASNAKP